MRGRMRGFRGVALLTVAVLVLGLVGSAQRDGGVVDAESVGYVPPNVSPFGDVPGTSTGKPHTFYKQIAWLAEEGVSTGYPLPGGKKEFRPSAPVLREQMAAFLYRLAGSPEVSSVPSKSPFADVSTGHAFYKEIVWLSQTGVTTGYPLPGGKKEFRPGQPVLREQMAAFMYRFRTWQEDGSKPSVSTAGGSPFADVSTGHVFYKEIRWLAAEGITTGYQESNGSTTFRPAAPVLREQMAAFMYRFEGVDGPVPVVTGVSPATGSTMGGGQVVITGKNFTKVQSVAFGETPATDYTVNSATRITATVPASWPGSVPVVVTSKRGASSGTVAYEYVDEPVDEQNIVPAEGTVTGEPGEVASVEPGEPDATGQVQEWAVTLVAGAAAPVVGDRYYLPSGGGVYTQGVAGEVTGVETLPDGTVVVTVGLIALEDVFDRYEVSYAGPVTSLDVEGAVAPQPDANGMVAQGAGTVGTVNLGTVLPSQISCLGDDGVSVEVSGSVGVRLENVSTVAYVRLGEWFASPSARFQISYDTVLDLDVTAAGKVTCTLPVWKKTAMKKVIPIGTTPVTVSVGPNVTFEVSGEASVTNTYRVSQTVGFGVADWNVSSAWSQKAHKPTLEASGEVTASAVLDAEIRLGIVDRGGLSLDPGVGAEATATASSGPPPQLCMGARVYLKGEAYGYLNVFKDEWTTPTLSKEVDLWQASQEPTCVDLGDEPGDPGGTTGTTTWVGPGGHTPSVSADGRYVAFVSGLSDLVADDTNGKEDAFVQDMQTGQTSLVSATPSGSPSNTYYYGYWSQFRGLSMSADGRYVAFPSGASDLVAGDTNGSWDVFVRDMQTGVTRLVSATPSGGSGNEESGYGATSVSADGRYVAFDSSASDLVTGDTNGSGNVFVRDMQTGQTSLVSATSSGGGGNDNSWDPSVSADGRYVAFDSSASDLVAGDTNGARDVFVRDMQSGVTRLVSAAPSCWGGSSSSSRQTSVSADGRYVAF
ncbi:MAG: S-layer homology domain-containing protein, partial [Aeromicrobium sp.]|uniref:S-layer homology domain-containing protein n=1 Tax=Aeromicrobium sp. TaxID=1871063 RepID=UPI0039E2D73F